MRRTRSARSGPPRRRSSYAALIHALATEATSGWILAGSGQQCGLRSGRALSGAEAFGIRQRAAGLHRSDRLGQPGPGVVLGQERLVASARGGGLVGDAGPPRSPLEAQPAGERPGHQSAPRLVRVSTVSCRRKASWSSWRATRSSRAATRARARASWTALGSAAWSGSLGSAGVVRPGRRGGKGRPRPGRRSG